MDRRIERKRRVWPVVVTLIVVAAAAAQIVRSELLDRVSTRSILAERVIVSTVMEGPFQEFIPVNGSVVPIRSVFLDAVEGGRVERIFVEAGTMVEEGDPILQLTNTNLILDIMWREADLFQQSNNLRNSSLLMEQFRLQLRRELADVDYRILTKKRALDRLVELAREDLVPEHELDETRDEYEYLVGLKELTLETQEKDSEFRLAQTRALEESLETMRGNLEIVKEKQQNLTIKVPVSGHLTSLDAEVGQSKAPGERLGQIDILQGFKVLARVDEHYLARVQIDRPGTFEFADRTHGVVVQKIYPEVREGRFEVDLVFEDEEPAGIRRGQTVRVRLELGEATDAILLAKGGFYQTTGGHWAFVLDDSGTVASRRALRIGRQNPEVFEVVEGLRPGERVITSSYEGFADQDRLILN